MKWFKHMSDSWNDEKIAAIRSSHGLEIYGFWWRILEIVANQMDNSPKTFCQYPPKVWANLAGISPKKFQKFAEILLKEKLIFAEFVGNDIKINIPNLSKIRDEWTQKQIRANEKTPE